jgi:ATP phosphoribosyltransferase
VAPIKIALPKGRLLKKTSALLHRAEWGLDEYHSRLDFYHPRSQKYPGLVIKVLHEKDIPIQVAVGNYDLGICSLDWLKELLVKYPSSNVTEVKDLGYGRSSLYVIADHVKEGVSGGLDKTGSGIIRIVSEYPNLAESFAIRHRLKRFSVFPVWGAAESYPPESAELALVAVKDASELSGRTVVEKVLDSSAVLIANSGSLHNKDMGDIVNSICAGALDGEKPVVDEPSPYMPPAILKAETGDEVWLALPDGHQQRHVLEILNRACIETQDYPSEAGNRRPPVNLEGVRAKVIRPQDIPLQVANGNFDLAITGRDWLTEHLCQFPSSPVQELLDLGYGKVRMVAVVSQGMPVDDVTGLREHLKSWTAPLRVASEYVQIADKYARDNRLSPYRVIPTWGATEAFLPEDADLLIENTETGRTIARHSLKIIDTIFVSTACLVGRKGNEVIGVKKDRISAIVSRLRAALEGRN